MVIKLRRKRSYKVETRTKIPGTQMPSWDNNNWMHTSILAKMERSPHLPSQDDLNKSNLATIFYKASCKLITSNWDGDPRDLQR